jgi:hypothetical protein
MPKQPTPVVNSDDVVRIVRRDFPAEQYADVMATLHEYGTEKWQQGIPRVQLAALKLADGNLTKLRRCISTATTDYRDVLAPAEYPGYLREVSSARRPGPDAKEVQRIIDDDWAQYEAWLNKGHSR